MLEQSSGTPDIARCVEGDKAQWDLFVRTYAGLIYSVVARTLGFGPGGEDTRDVAQDVFVRLVKDDFKALKQYDPARCALTTWLTIIARNTAVDHMRRNKADVEPLEWHEHDLGSVLADPARTAERRISCPDGLLTNRQQLVMRLLYSDEFDVPEVAEHLGVTAQTVRSIKHQAINRLRDHHRAAAC